MVLTLNSPGVPEPGMLYPRHGTGLSASPGGAAPTIRCDPGNIWGIFILKNYRLFI